MLPKSLTYSGKLSMFVMALMLFLYADAAAQKKKRKSASSTAIESEIVLAENQLSKYRILLPSAPSASERKAADILQQYFLEVSGAALPVVSAEEHRSKYEIVLGQNDRLDELAVNIDFNSL